MAPCSDRTTLNHLRPTNRLDGLAGLDKPVKLAKDVVLLPARANPAALLAEIENLVVHAPWRHMQVPGGKKMSVAMTNCGRYGWVSNKQGYRYQITDPMTDKAWPSMPANFAALATDCAREAGFDSLSNQSPFTPDACLINGYRASAKLSLHQDANEIDFSQPIVSISLGASARFVIGGQARGDPTTGIMLNNGDVLVWGRSARLMHHGVGVPRTQSAGRMPSKLLADFIRINLTFRRAG